jgi:hypothetical protein
MIILIMLIMLIILIMLIMFMGDHGDHGLAEVTEITPHDERAEHSVGHSVGPELLAGAKGCATRSHIVQCVGEWYTT